MNNNLRQEILKEIKFLLNEQEEAEQGVFGGTFSEDLDDILEDINDANIKEIAGFSYIDLTTMEDSTDEGELNLFVKSFKDVSDSSEITAPDAQKAIKTVCSKNVLLINSVGPTDTYFYVSCKQIPGGLNVPVSAKKIGLQGQEAIFPGIIKKIKQGSTAPVSAPSTPVASTPIASTPEQPATIPATTETSMGERYKRSFGCKDIDSVKAWQGYLGVSQDAKIGVNTLMVAMKKNPALNKYDIKAYMAVDANGNPTKEALNLQQSLCNYLAKPATKQYHQENQTKVKKESKNYYDDKKLVEAKQLFNKLLKNI